MVHSSLRMGTATSAVRWLDAAIEKDVELTFSDYRVLVDSMSDSQAIKVRDFPMRKQKSAAVGRVRPPPGYLPRQTRTECFFEPSHHSTGHNTSNTKITTCP